LVKQQNKAATVIQSTWRTFVCQRRLQATIRAVVTIQKHLRAVEARRLVKKMRVRWNAAVLIQRHIRGYLGRKEAKQIRLAGNLRMIEMIRRWKEMEAAVIVQRAFKHLYLAKKRERSIIRIQALTRGFLTRRTTSKAVQQARSAVAAATQRASKGVERTIHQRTTSALASLCDPSAWHRILHTLQELEHCTSMLPSCSERIVAENGTYHIVRFMMSVRRDVISLTAIAICLNILTNMTNHDPSAAGTFAAMIAEPETFVDILQNNQDPTGKNKTKNRNFISCGQLLSSLIASNEAYIKVFNNSKPCRTKLTAIYANVKRRSEKHSQYEKNIASCRGTANSFLGTSPVDNRYFQRTLRSSSKPVTASSVSSKTKTSKKSSSTSAASQPSTSAATAGKRSSSCKPSKVEHAGSKTTTKVAGKKHVQQVVTTLLVMKDIMTQLQPGRTALAAPGLGGSGQSRS